MECQPRSLSPTCIQSETFLPPIESREAVHHFLPTPHILLHIIQDFYSLFNMYIGGNFRSLLLLLVVVLPYSFLHVTVTGIRVTYQYQYQYEQQDGHQEDHYQRELSSVPFKESLLPCPKPQGVNLRGRGEAWVDLSRSTIFKHPNGKGEYIFERDMTLRLSNFSNFVSLISYDDKCQVRTPTP